MDGSAGDVHVLHVDDDPQFLRLTRECLERETDDLVVSSAESAHAALDRLAEQRVDCVVSDYQMPETDGLELFEAVRAERPGLPFILFTGEGSETIASEAISAGVTDYLQKSSGTDQYTLLANRVRNAVERASARREVRKTQERFRKLLADSADYIIVVDTDGTVEYVTPSVEHVLGYEPDELTGESALELIHPADRDRAADDLASLVSDPDAETTLEVRAERADGSWRWLEVKSRNMVEDPTIGGIVGNVRDVTARREREAAVDWHRTVIERMEEGVYVVDADYRLQFVNYRIDDIPDGEAFDWADRSLSYLADLGMITEAEVASIEAAVDALLGGEADEVRVELEPAVPEEQAVVELRLTTMTPEGEESLVLGTTRDVTAQVERERELRQATERYRTLIDNFPNGGVFTFDEDLRYTLAGGEGLEAVGLRPEDVEGVRPRDLFPDDIAAETEAYYRAALDGEDNTFEQQFQGEHYRIHTLPVCDGTGGGDGSEIVAGMAVSQNVTEQEAHRRELERQNERLDAFTSVVSHDLRNPLTVLEGALEMAEKTGERRHFERSQRAVERMEQLVADLRTLARQGDRVTDRQPVDLSTLVENCWRTVETSEASLSVETDATVGADANRLKQLFENVFRNAVEHGGSDVRVTVGDLPDGFYVADDGPGIPDDDRDRVFESGYSTATGGTGFGLAIVERIATAHGWNHSLTESADGGTRLEFTGVDDSG